MRLINVRTLEIEEFWEEEIPDYAILSHTWGERKAEVSFQDWKNLQTASQKQGFKKIIRACEQAAQDGDVYVWVDTNCINKDSSAELSEAINSMFAWYRRSTRCYVFLEDFLWEDRMRDLTTKLSVCRWFTRGWTLQELLAPKEVIFFDRNWVRFGTRTSLAKQISSFTPIGGDFLIDRPIGLASIAERMSWLSPRKTKRVEDMAYCMLGIFDINMPLLYGEGSKSFVRLQEEIIKVSNDQSIFCWAWDPSIPPGGWTSIFAPSAQCFQDSRYFVSTHNMDPPYSMTNAGLHIQLRLLNVGNYYLALLEAQDWRRALTGAQLCIPLIGRPSERMWRGMFPPQPIHVPSVWADQPVHLQIGGSNSALDLWLHRFAALPRIKPRFNRPTYNAILPIFIGPGLEIGSVNSHRRHVQGEVLERWKLKAMCGEQSVVKPTLEHKRWSGGFVALTPGIGDLDVGTAMHFDINGENLALLFGIQKETGSWICDVSNARRRAKAKFAGYRLQKVQKGLLQAVVCDEDYTFEVTIDGRKWTVRPACIIKAKS